MKRIAIVIPRYGEAINGGAEAHARLLAEHLAEEFEVEVLTSCARDYTDWAMRFPPGPCRVGGIRVWRFPHPPRNDLGRARVPLRHKLRFKLRHLLRWLPGPRVARPRGEPAYDGLTFLRRQGPHCVDLFEHLRGAAPHYDAVIFFAALYELTALGIQHWGRRSILVPLLHDEKPIYLPVFHQVMRSAGAILFNTDAERRLAARLYGLDTSKAGVAGLGISTRRPGAGVVQAVLGRFGLAPGYMIYVGRIEVAKGCRELVEAFLELARTDPKARLVMVGQGVMQVPSHPQIVVTGYLAESDRDALVAAAGALVIPSRYESLSMVLLEALSLHTPVIANGHCEVLADHVRLSGAGVVYRRRRGLVAAMRSMMSLPAPERERMGALGAAYVERQYSWPRVMGIFAAAIAQVSALPPDPVDAQAWPSTTS
ncbi:MAG: glycosyltransferase family 4 protein [Rubrivivax sp.]|nr:glycosyltransferase family 4 protein [Rubrivivax sp.]